MLDDESGELVEAGELHVEISCGQDQTLHLKELLQGIKSITQVDIFVGLVCMDLVVFGSHEQRGHSQ